MKPLLWYHKENLKPQRLWKNSHMTNTQRIKSLAQKVQQLFTLPWRQCYGNDVIHLQQGRYVHCETTEVAVAQSLNLSPHHESNGVRCKCWQRSAVALTHLISAITHSQAARVELWRWNSSVALCGLPYVNNIICKTHHFPAVTYAAVCVFNYVAPCHTWANASPLNHLHGWFILIWFIFIYIYVCTNVCAYMFMYICLL